MLGRRAEVLAAQVDPAWRAAFTHFFVMPSREQLATILRESFYATLLPYEGHQSRFVVSLMPSGNDPEVRRLRAQRQASAPRHPPARGGAHTSSAPRLTSEEDEAPARLGDAAPAHLRLRRPEVPLWRPSPHPRRAHHPRRCRGQTRPTRSPPAPRAPEAPALHRPARPSLRRLTDTLVVSLRRHALGTSVSWGLERLLHAPRPPPHTASPPRPPPPRLLPLTPVSSVVPPVRGPPPRFRALFLLCVPPPRFRALFLLCVASGAAVSLNQPLRVALIARAPPKPRTGSRRRRSRWPTLADLR